jgi:hypothetical protein
MVSVTMNEPEEPPRRYRWPWIALAFVLLFIVLCVIWMTVDVKKLEHERDFNSPLPASQPAH